MQLVIYSERTTSRLEYVLSVFIQQLLGIEYQLVQDKDFFRKSDFPKINYSQEPISSKEIYLFPAEILFEKGIKFQSIKLFQSHGLPAFFGTAAPKSDLPFDIFAVVFYLLSRYEEYLSFQEDGHGRFVASESLAFQNGFLQQPLINLWSLQFKDILFKKHPSLKFSLPNYQFQPTFDIDFAWAYRHKGFFRNLGAYAKGVINRDFATLKERFLVQINQQKDPFYTFDYLETLHEKERLSPIYFFLLGDYGAFDKNTSPDNQAFQNLIRSIHQTTSTGIHPSYQSNYDVAILKMEKERLEKISQASVIKSRQHFLKLTFPQTYQNLIEIGIQNDYSMGYASEIGFRASIATPFLWYDLKNESITNLWVHPFQIMDVTLQQYLQLSRAEAIQKSTELIEITKAVGGTFVTLWHNSSFSNEEKWRGWKEVYERIVEAAN